MPPQRGLQRKRKSTSGSNRPPEGKKFAPGGHHFVSILPTNSVTPSLSQVNNGSVPLTPPDYHADLIKKTVHNSIDSPSVQPKKKRKTEPKTVVRKTAQSHQLVEVDKDIFKTVDIKNPTQPPSTLQMGKKISRLP